MVGLSLEAEGEVGSKHELYPPKKIREALRLRPGRKIRFRVEGEKLIVEVISSIEELIALEPTTTVSLDEFHRHRRELSKAFEAG